MNSEHKFWLAFWCVIGMVVCFTSVQIKGCSVENTKEWITFCSSTTPTPPNCLVKQINF